MAAALSDVIPVRTAASSNARRAARTSASAARTRAFAGEREVPGDRDSSGSILAGDPDTPATESVPPATPFFPSFLSRATSARVLGFAETELDAVLNAALDVGVGTGAGAGDVAIWARSASANIVISPWDPIVAKGGRTIIAVESRMPLDPSPLAFPDAAHLYATGGRLLAAGVLGGLIGLQRERVHSAAGLRTHILVALGAALFVLAGGEAGFLTSDVSRVVQGIVAGIGFLGAGTILKLAERSEVHGLTTAATIWVTAAVGVAASIGPLWLPALAAILTWAVLALAVRLESRRDKLSS